MAEDKLLAEWFWVDRWDGSSAPLLPMEARGLYREMLSQAWRRGARLPNDHEAIQRAIRCTAEEWARCWPKVSPYWRVDGAHLVNDTQAEVYAAAKARAEAASERGKAGARARAQVRAQAGAQVVPGRKPPSPSPETDPPQSPPPAEVAGRDAQVGPGQNGYGHGARTAGVIERVQAYAIDLGYRLSRPERRMLAGAVKGGHSFEEIKASIDDARARGQPTLIRRL